MKKQHIKTSELVSIISHEIKNSLNPVINLSGLMLKEKDRKLSSNEKEYLEVIERSGRRILTLVEQFSYLNRLKNSKITLMHTPLPLQVTIENTVNSSAPCRNRKPVRPVCIIEGGEHEPSADPELFKRIITCLTEFFISARDIDYLYFIAAADSNFVSVRVSEKEPALNGCKTGGGDFDTALLSESSLLWYAIGEELITAVGGSSDIRSSDSGIEWFFSIPVSPGISVQASESVQEDHKTEGGFVLMVIDDDPDTIIPLRAIAEHEFNGLCRLVTAHSGSEGIDLLEKTRPDIVLLDLTLPDINGFSLIRSIKNFFVKKEVPVIAFTGHDIGHNRDKIVNAGFDDIILKPFDIDEFVEKIRKWIR